MDSQSAGSAVSERASSRAGIGLCLSGGGFRAALFHLGAVRRLNETGILGQLRTISSVSGGSILSAFLAQRMVDLKLDTLQFREFETDVAAPFREFTSRDLRTLPVLLHLPWNWAFPGLRARHLARRYCRRLTRLELGQLPNRPTFIYCATDMVFGTNWEFGRAESGGWRAGYTKATTRWPLGRAVAASSCFPPLFGPFPASLPSGSFGRYSYSEEDRGRLLRQLAFTDGGVYDNLGLEPVWKEHETVIVSDGGAPFVFGVGSMPWKRMMRYVGLVMAQAVTLRTRMLQEDLRESRYAGATWRISDGTSAEDAAMCPGYGAVIAEERIAAIRTDLDRFTDGEQRILENHGYARAAARISANLAHLLPPGAPPARPPHPDFMDETRASRLLADSSRRLCLRRLLHIETGS